MQEAIYGPDPAPHCPAMLLTNGGAADAHAHAAGVGGRRAPEEELALIALSHTRVEHRLYLAMAEASGARPSRAFTVRALMGLTGLSSYSTIRRGLGGLVSKLSVERVAAAPRGRGHVYAVYGPEEIFARRRERGLAPYPREVCAASCDAPLGVAVTRVAARHELSRREAQVALACAEGLTNAGIGEKLFVGEQTVKFHLRQIFIKLRVRRRAELVSLLLRP